jgi:hypothetical protein
MQDVAPYLQKYLPGIVVDYKIGRQMSQASDSLAKLKSEGRLGSRVIIGLGTNGAFSQKQLESLLDSLKDAEQVILVNTRVPEKWESVVNSTIAKTAAKFPNTTVVDWYSASAGKKAFFEPDGIHLVPKGAEYYVSLIANAVMPLPPKSAAS